VQPPPPREGQQPPADEEATTNEQQMLVARPFVAIKGHTAFLTFATAGLLPQPNPNHHK
jgi:hypothetical protein